MSARPILLRIGLIMLAVVFAAETKDAPSSIAILTAAGVAAYSQAIDGFRSAMNGDAEAAVFELNAETEPTLLAALRAAKPQLIVAIGSRATELAGELSLPVISTMVLDGETRAETREVARILLDVPPAAVFGRIKQLLPACRRIAVIRGRNGPSHDEIQQQAAASGLSVEIVDCKDPAELLRAIASLRDRADLVWCLPDRFLYQPASMNALILASIRNRLPLIGFSEGFVKAGALIGFYADYRDIGAQTASVLSRFKEGRPIRPKEPPRTVKTAVNERIARTLGFEIRQGSFDQRIEIFK